MWLKSGVSLSLNREEASNFRFLAKHIAGDVARRSLRYVNENGRGASKIEPQFQPDVLGSLSRNAPVSSPRSGSLLIGAFSDRWVYCACAILRTVPLVAGVRRPVLPYIDQRGAGPDLHHGTF